MYISCIVSVILDADACMCDAYTYLCIYDASNFSRMDRPTDKPILGAGLYIYVCWFLVFVDFDKNLFLEGKTHSWKYKNGRK